LALAYSLVKNVEK
jgi:hypothetical protein